MPADITGHEIFVGQLIVRGKRPGSSGASLNMYEVLNIGEGGDRLRVHRVVRKGVRLVRDTTYRPRWIQTMPHNTAVVDDFVERS